jgi:lipoate---protein ligase
VEAVPGVGELTGPEPFGIDTLTATVSALHGADLAALLQAGPGSPVRTRAAWWCVATTPGLALGSTQPDDTIDLDACARHGIEVGRRRSGGGAVLVMPAETLWLDVVVTRDDPLWRDDVGAAMWWLGECWAAALESARSTGGTVAGPAGPLDEPVAVHRGPLIRTDWSSRVCFDGIGAGEVTCGGHKVVGISQRRTRSWCRLQSSAHLVWRHELVTGLVRARPDELRPAATVTADVGPVLDALLRTV